MGKLAINGGTPVRTEPFASWPVFGECEEKKLLEVLRSGTWGIGGECIPEFEQRFAEFQQAKHGIACCNGTIAIDIALLACGVGAGDEVIVPPYTFMATATAVISANATPVFVDIDPETCNIDPKAIEGAITEKTKAIIVVHVGGCPCDMDAILEIAKKNNLVVIEDSAHAHGAEWKGRRVGALGDLGTFSFQSSKNLTSGEGGIIVTNNEQLATGCESIHNCGRSKTGAWYEHYQFGANYRLSEFQAGLLLCGLDRLPEQMARRAKNAKILDEAFAEIEALQPQKIDPRVTAHGYHLYLLRVPQEYREGISLEKFEKAIQGEGILFGKGYTPLYKLRMYQDAKFGQHGCPVTCPYHGSEPMDYKKVSLPESEKAAAEMLWCHHRLLLGSEKDMLDIVEGFKKVLDNVDELRG